MPAARIFRFARTSRCAIVGSGTRNARAISSVVRPPSVRSVSATCASSASAGWQHVKISSSRSSANAVSSMSSSAAAPARRAGCVFSREGALAPDAVDRAVARRRHAARRPGCPGCRRAASARRRSRTPPARPPRRGRSRRGCGSASASTRPHSSRKTCSSSVSAPRAAGPRRCRPCGRRGRVRRSRVAASRSSASTGRSRRAPPSSRRTARRSSACSPPSHAHRRRGRRGLKLRAAENVPGSSEIAKYSLMIAFCSSLRQRSEPVSVASSE